MNTHCRLYVTPARRTVASFEIDKDQSVASPFTLLVHNTASGTRLVHCSHDRKGTHTGVTFCALYHFDIYARSDNEIHFVKTYTYHAQALPSSVRH